MYCVWVFACLNVCLKKQCLHSSNVFHLWFFSSVPCPSPKVTRRRPHIQYTRSRASNCWWLGSTWMWVLFQGFTGNWEQVHLLAHTSVFTSKCTFSRLKVTKTSWRDRVQMWCKGILWICLLWFLHPYSICFQNRLHLFCHMTNLLQFIVRWHHIMFLHKLKQALQAQQT